MLNLIFCVFDAGCRSAKRRCVDRRCAVVFSSNRSHLPKRIGAAQSQNKASGDWINRERTGGWSRGGWDGGRGRGGQRRQEKCF